MNAKVSAVLIVRDEQAVLARCLASLSDLDEVVVYDTGSEDQTVDVARSFAGARVVRAGRAEPFHFAEARNQAAALASNMWALSVDADEVLLPGAAWALKREIVRHGSKSAFRLRYLMRVPESDRTSEMRMLRLFRRDRFAWAYRVHEQLLPLRKPGPAPEVGDVDEPALEHLPGDKGERRRQNLELLKLARDESPENARLALHLGRELMAGGDHAGAEREIRSYCDAGGADGPVEVSEALVHLGQCLAKLGRLEEAHRCFNRAASAMPDRRETYFRAAAAFAEASRPLAAREWLRACLKVDPARRPCTPYDADDVWGDAPAKALERLERLIAGAGRR